MEKDNSIKEIVCITASVKTGGRCIAGKNLPDNTWVRPVSDGKEDAITNQQSRYQDGKPAQVLDIIEIPVLKSIPKQYQKENILIDPSKKWQKKGVFDRQKLGSLLDDPPSLWQHLDSSYYGKNDRIPVSETKDIDNSLYLIQTKCEINVKTEGIEFNNPKKMVRCSFTYKNTEHKLPVTDPAIRDEYLSKKEGDYDIGQKYVCVSLALEYKDGYSYLLAATII